MVSRGYATTDRTVGLDGTEDHACQQETDTRDDSTSQSVPGRSERAGIMSVEDTIFEASGELWENWHPEDFMDSWLDMLRWERYRYLPVDVHE